MAVAKTVECDVCGMEIAVPDGKFVVGCKGKDCKSRLLIPRAIGRKIIRLNCCSAFISTFEQRQHRCTKCGEMNLFMDEIAEIRCKQPVYASKMKTPYTEVIANLKKSLETAEEEKKKAKEELERAKLEVEKERRTIEVQKQMIEFLQQTNKEQYKGFLETMKEDFNERNSPKVKPVIAKQEKNETRESLANPYSRLRPRQPTRKSISS